MVSYIIKSQTRIYLILWAPAQCRPLREQGLQIENLSQGIFFSWSSVRPGVSPRVGSVFWKLLWRQFAEFVSSLCVEGEAARTSHELGWKTRPRNLWLINKPSQRTRITMAKRVVRNLLSSPGHGQIFCKQFRRTKGLLSRKYQENVGNWQYFSYLLLKMPIFNP